MSTWAWRHVCKVALAAPEWLAWEGQGRDSAGSQTSYLTRGLARDRGQSSPWPVAGRAFFGLTDGPRLCSHDVRFHEAVAHSDHLFAMLNAAQILFSCDDALRIGSDSCHVL